MKVFCPPDCKCGRHNNPLSGLQNTKCAEGCTCKKHNNPLVGRKPKPGSTNPETQHDHVRSARGRADEYRCVNCSRGARDWANTHGKDRMVADNYSPMCRYCHIVYDQMPNVTAARMSDPDWMQRAMSEIMSAKRNNREVMPI